MSVAYYIVLDVEDPGFETFVNGKAVARAADRLNTLCAAQGLPPLDSFLGQSMDDFADFLDEDIPLPDGEDGAEKWFDPQEGIRLITALSAAIQANPAALGVAAEGVAEVLEDLEEYRAVLAQAAAIEARWYLALDI